jgi:HipA-like protein
MSQLFKKFTSWLGTTKDVPPASESPVVFKLSLGHLIIGHLRREPDRWIFEYTEEFRNQEEIKPIMDFPTVTNAYQSDELWPFFKIRVPSKNQPSIHRRFTHDQLNGLTVIDMLKFFGRRSAANPFILTPE